MQELQSFSPNYILKATSRQPTAGFPHRRLISIVSSDESGDAGVTCLDRRNGRGGKRVKKEKTMLTSWSIYERE